MSLCEKGGRAWSMPGCILLRLSSPSLTEIYVRTSERGGSHSTLTHSLLWVKGVPPLEQSDLFVSRRQGKEAASDIRVASIRSRRKHGDLGCEPAAHGGERKTLGWHARTGHHEEGQQRRRNDMKAGMAQDHPCPLKTKEFVHPHIQKLMENS